MDKNEYSELLSFISNHTYPESFNKNDKRALRSKAKSFVVNDEALYHVANKKTAKVVYDDEEKATLIAAMHSALGGGHFGQAAMMEKLSKRFCWKGMTEQVRDFVKRCTVCQLANAPNKPPAATLHPVQVC